MTVYFEFDKYQLTSAAKSSLDSLITRHADKIHGFQFDVVGHCDSRGSNEYNNRLSEKRAEAVRRYLLLKGFGNDNFSVVNGKGENEPLNDNVTDGDRQMNRRVQVQFITSAEEQPSNTKTLSEKIADTKTTTGTNIVLRNLNFVGGRHQILPESHPVIQELLQVMIANPKLAIRIEGHICCRSDNEDGEDLETGLLNLSEARSAAIYQFLLNNGIDASRLSYIGFGHSQPLFPYPEKNDEEMKLNRRVEIKILQK